MGGVGGRSGLAEGLKGDFFSSPAVERFRSEFATASGLYTWAGEADGRLWSWRAIGLLLIC